MAPKRLAKLRKIFRKTQPDMEDSEKNTTRPHGFIARVWDLYAGGFREMTVGRRLWALILVKLAVMFLVFKLFFFPDKLKEDYDTDAERAAAVRTNLTDTSRR